MRLRCLLLWPLFACVHPANQELPAAADPEIERLVASLAKARGLSPTRPVVALRLDPDPFHEELARAMDLETQLDSHVAKAEWMAFGFASASVDPFAVYRSTLSEQVAAFYDSKRKHLILPSAPPQSFSEVGPDFLVAHELEHAIQDQHFDLERLSGQRKDDPALALRALVEGDANLAATEVLALENGVPIPEMMARMVRNFRVMPLEEQLELSGHSSAMAAAPLVVREGLLFPYLVGQNFLARLQLTGGNALVDKVFSHPPESTLQILNPELYLAGERAVPIGLPPPLAGDKLVSQGTLGALGFKVWLSEHHCPEALAAAWRGDAYTVSQGADGGLTLQLVLAFSDATAATQLSLLVGRLSVIKGEPEERDENGMFVRPGHAVASRDRVVALVFGGADDAVATALLALAMPALPPTPPFGALTLAALPALPEDHASGAVKKRQFESVPLGLRFTVPRDWRVEVPAKETAALKVEAVLLPEKARSALRGVAMLAFDPRPFPLSSSDGAIAGIGPELTAVMRVRASLGPAEAVDLGWAHGRRAAMSQEGTRLEGEVVLAPLCGGRYSLLVLATSSPAGQATLFDWVRGLHVAADAPICAASGG